MSLASKPSQRQERARAYDLTGWFALLGWQTSLVGTAYAAGQVDEPSTLVPLAVSDSKPAIRGLSRA